MMIPNHTTLDCTSCCSESSDEESCSCCNSRSKEAEEEEEPLDTTARTAADVSTSSSSPSLAIDVSVCSWSDIRIHERIGNGSFAMVLKATYKETKEVVALKCIKEGDLDSNAQKYALDDLHKEAQILARLNDHPNIVSLKAVGGSTTFFLIQLLQKETLDDMIKLWGEQQAKIEKKSRSRSFVFPKMLPFGRNKNKQSIVVPSLYDRLLNIGFQLSKALEYIHSKQILHCDLKPSNIGFDLDGNVQIFDFGLAEDLSSSDPIELCISGSYRYMSPEVMEGLPIMLSADIYSFGMTLWELVMLEKPFKNIHKVDPLTNFVVRGEGRPTLDKIQSQQLRDMLTSCWHSDPSKRINSETLVMRMTEVLSEVKQQQEKATAAEEEEAASKQKQAKKKVASKKKVVFGEGADLVYNGRTIEVVVHKDQEQRSTSSSFCSSLSRRQRRRHSKNTTSNFIGIHQPFLSTGRKRVLSSTKTLSTLSGMEDTTEEGEGFGR